MARNYTFRVTGNNSDEREVDDSYLSAFVRGVDWISDRPTSGTLKIEFKDWEGQWYPLRGGTIDLSAAGKQPSPFIEGECLRSLRVTMSGVAVDAELELVIYTDTKIGGLLDPNVYNKNDQFSRVKTQGLTIGQQQILDGFALESNWVEQNIAQGSSRYAEFTVPAGFKMVLALRLLNPQSDNFLYRVYPQGTYTAGAAKTDDANNFAKTRNLNQSSGLSVNPLVRINVSVLPAATAQIIYEPIWGQVNNGNRSAGDLETDDSFLLLNADQKFLLEMHNGSTTSAGSAQVKLQYAFIPAFAVSPPVV